MISKQHGDVQAGWDDYADLHINEMIAVTGSDTMRINAKITRRISREIRIGITHSRYNYEHD